MGEINYDSLAAQYGGKDSPPPVDYDALASQFGGEDEIINPAITSAGAIDPTATERTWGEAFTDVGASAVKTAGSLAKLTGQGYGLITGDMDTTATQAGGAVEQFGQWLKSPGLQERERRQAENVRGQTGFFNKATAAVAGTLTDPALASTFVTEQAVNLLPAAGAAKIAKGISLARGASQAAATAAGTTAAIGTSAAQQGASVGAQTYEDIYRHLTEQGMPPEQAASETINKARLAGLSAGAISLLSQKIVPGGQLLEKSLAGGKQGATRLVAGLKTAGGESLQNTVEEGLGQFGSNVAVSQVDPTRTLSEGVPETMGMAAAGGGILGGALGALSAQPTAQPTPTPTESPAVQTTLEQSPGIQSDAPIPAARPANPLGSQIEAPTEPNPYKEPGERTHAGLTKTTEEMGVETPSKLPPQTVEEVRAEAAAALQANPNLAAEIVNDLLESGPRALTPVELAILEPYQKNLRAAWDAAKQRVESLPEGAEKTAARDEFNKINERMMSFLQMRFRNNSQAGKNLRALQDRGRDDILNDLPTFLFAAEAKLGRPLYESESRELSATHAEFNKKEKAKEKFENTPENTAPTNTETQQVTQTIRRTAPAGRQTRKATTQSIVDDLLVMYGYTPSDAMPKAPTGRPKKPVAKKPAKPSTTLDEQQQREVDYETRRAKVVKDAEDAERRAIAEEDQDQSNSREQGIQYAEANVHPDDVAHPDDIQKNAETRQPEIDARIRQAGEQAGHEFDLLNDNDPGHPEYGKAAFMEMGPTLVIRIVETMYRQSKDIARFSARMLTRFGRWVKPHIQALWEAAKKGAKAVQDYLSKIIIPEEVRNAGPNARGAGLGAMGADGKKPIPPEHAAILAYAQESLQKGNVEYGPWKTRMEANQRPNTTEADFLAAKNAFKSEFNKRSRQQSTPEQVVENWKGEQVDDIHTIAAELAKAHVYADDSLTGQSPDHALELTRRVQADLAAIGHTLTESETARAITNYGPQPAPKVSPEQARLKELKGQILVKEKQADAADSKTPWIRRLFKKPSDIIRREIATLNDQLRKLTDVEVQAGRMKTPQQRVIAALNNQIKDIEAELAGAASKRNPLAPIPDNAEIQALRAHRDALKKALDEKRDPTGDIGYNERAAAAALASAKFYKRKLAEGRYTTAKAPERQDTVTTYAAKFAAKRAKEAFDEAAEASGIPAEERLANTVAGMHRRIAELGAYLNTGNKPGEAPGRPRPIDKSRPEYKVAAAELARLKKILSNARLQGARGARAAADALVRALDAEIDLITRSIPANKRAGRDTTAQEAALATLIAQRDALDAPLIERLKKVEEAKAKRFASREAEAIARGKPPVKLPRRTPREAELDRLTAETAIAKRKMFETLHKLEMANQTTPEKVKRWISEITTMVKELVLSVDASAIGRQGAALMSHTRESWKALKGSVDAFRSEQRMVEIEAEMTRDPEYAAAQRDKLQLTDPTSSSMLKMEEAHNSRLLRVISEGLNKRLGKAKALNFMRLFPAFARQYGTYLNILKFEVYKKLKNQQILENGLVTQDQSKAIASLVNNFAGRGSIGKYDSSIPAFLTVFTAPRWYISRIQMMLGYGMWGKGTKGTRKLAAKEYAKAISFMVAANVLIGMLKKTNPEDDDGELIEVNPLASDFMATRIGDFRVRLFGGLTPAIVLLSRLVTGEMKSKGKNKPLRGAFLPLNTFRDQPLGKNKSFGASDISSTLGGFVESKAAPVPSMLWNIVKGEGYMGKKLEASDFYPIPLQLRQQTEILNSDRPPLTKAGLSAGAFIGLDVNEWKKKNK